MGLIAYRFIARKNERQLYPGIDPSWGEMAFAKPSQAQRVVIRDVEPSKPVYVTPYVLGGFDQVPEFRARANTDLLRRKWGATSDTRRRPTCLWT